MGSEDRCPRGASGVQISQGKSWAFVAPYSGNANQPSDVVRGVAEHVESEYQNFTMTQNEPTKFNGLDIALGHFTGIDRDGIPISLVVVGIAAPGGRYFVASSSVSQSEVETLVGRELTKMLNSLRFAGQ